MPMVRERESYVHEAAIERGRLRRVRQALESEMERLIDLLDRLDGDPDCEPSLGSLAAHQNYSQEGWALGTCDDREDEHDGAEEDGAERDKASAGRREARGKGLGKIPARDGRAL